mmetsp:Transcript_33744/g.34376  ORF Transcript_33744/g.34376 Transcript_33744/m.34376 type:complete len:85 (+) Transcript_33744:267-521(+)
MRHSVLQKNVLSLYRLLLRSAKEKDQKLGNNLYQYVRKEFRNKASSVDRGSFQLIEHLVRYGHKQHKLMQSPGFSSAKIVSVHR